MIAVFTPTTLPCVSTSGPPEFPGLSAASVWMTFSMIRPSFARSERPSALTTPAAQREVRRRVGADHGGAIRRAFGEPDLDLVRAIDDVSVRQHVAIGRNDQ